MNLDRVQLMHSIRHFRRPQPLWWWWWLSAAAKIIIIIYKNTEKMVFIIFDVYPQKVGRMIFFGTTTGKLSSRRIFWHSVCYKKPFKKTSFLWFTAKTVFSIFDVYPSFFDRMTMKPGPKESYDPCASFLFLIRFSHPRKNWTFSQE